ncbi:MAG: 2-oxoacid:acceptor oxidoreductase subunit alpha [Candidatus Omnitrophota bacterium]|jgi:2-oxoglutarate ferredoxin oxidoreductase subunit alpha
MEEFSILIGGKAGFGIDKSSLIIADILGDIGYRIYVYRDYPSLIRGGHTFSIIRASRKKIAVHSDKIDLLIALDQNTFDQHKARLKEGSAVIYDSDSVKAEGIAAPLGNIIKEENAPDIMRNTAIIGGACKAIGVDWNVADRALRKNISGQIDLNLKIAKRVYDETVTVLTVPAAGQKQLPIVTGNEATSMGMVKAGLNTYIAYPMTPTSPILHYLAANSEKFKIKVIHPESEIAVMLMALGFSYCGEKVAVGTSGGGFCLMTEGLSFSAMAELPVVVIVGQRPGPSTGLPTYSTQTELHFVLSAGQGEFTRFVVAPGDAEEAYYWSGIAMNLSTKFQIPSIILTDKTLGEGSFSFDADSVKNFGPQTPLAWDRNGQYKRYLNTAAGISPLAFAPDKDAVVKVSSYEHDESGITTEDPAITKVMQDKRLGKEKLLRDELDGYDTVNVYGKKDSAVALLCWGSNKGVAIEAAEHFGIKVIQPVVMSPFPLGRLKEALRGIERLIAVENNATGQLTSLVNKYGIGAPEKILKYDGRPFSLDELIGRIGEIVK